MLSADQVQRFHDQGYLVLPGAVPPARVEEVRALVQAVRGGEKQAGYFKNASGPLFNAHFEEPLLLHTVSLPAIRTALGQLLGAPPMICQSMFFFAGSRTRPHQDEFYMAPSPLPLIGSWIAMQDVTIDDGPLGVLPGSHRGPVTLAKDIPGQWWKDPAALEANFARVAGYTDMSRIIPVTPRAGDVIFFHGRLIHCGLEPSTPERPRWSFVSHHFRSDGVLDDSNNGLAVRSLRME